ncbi:MAG: hypothetical protein M3494_00090 [Actinomycetota bacterium]|jgi:uncharacterized protein YqgV (UPF0045/DUF77 family)|nr:hypothetical protein [Rubrobacter sp.]MDQ3506412.1 hypothetical protein [Actinomycetota bacterium]
MPGYYRAELSAEMKITPSPGAEKSPTEQTEAAREAAGDTGLAHEAGPETVVLAGSREEVLAAMSKVIEASLDAGARTVEIKVEAEGDAPRFGEEHANRE